MVGRVQDHLEAIYGYRCELRAAEYLVDEAAARALGGTGRAREELLVADDGEELGLALYLSKDLLERVRAYEEAPPDVVVSHDLPAYCEVAEGVSHFLYITFAAREERQVSLLELEAQAEVDKFVSCALARWNQNVSAWAKELLARMFEHVGYLPSLSADERHRYEEANRLAGQYCRQVTRLLASGRMDRLLAELRKSYRLGAKAKLAYLASAR
ncbi:MAG: hypothetical protein ACOZIN_14840 [Myxococcota bacterium]